MKRTCFLVFVAALLGGTCGAQSSDQKLDELDQRQFLASRPESRPAVDARERIKQSTSFLKDREPEMTTDEYALYERIAAMLTTNSELAVRLLEGMVNGKEQPSPAFAFILGNAYAAASQFDRAEASYHSAVQRFPTFLRAWDNLALLYYNDGRFTEAAECFAKAVSLGDRESATLGLLGYCLERKGDTIAAETAYTQALGAEPANLDWKQGLLRLAIAAKQYGRAERLAQGLIKDKPTDIQLWMDYAGVLVADGRKLEAMTVLEQAQTAMPLDADSLLLLGDLYAEHGLADDAVNAYRKVFATAAPRGEQKLLQFAGVLIATGKLDEAGRTLAALPAELSPAARLERLQAQADLALARKRWPEARAKAEALLKAAPLNGRALLTVGQTYLEENNLPQATFAFEMAAQIPESAYQANLELANIELKNRHFAQAASRLEKALKIQRTDTIEDYLARIRALVPPEDKSS
ncbi:MAG TPA: tetratricopeptide repeat protein [Lacunisphaera sp.]|nr:tetratricopeptide repeat protein [Lacunisphaera sp.]